MFSSFPPLACAARTEEDDGNERPAKRIKVETGDTVSEADVGNLKNPYLNWTVNHPKET